MPKALITGTSVVPSAGGMAKTMRKFCEVLGGRIVSFTSQKFPELERAAFPEVCHALTARNPLLNWYGWASKDARRKAEAFAEDADLLTCHVMLRYHAHWVRRMAKRKGVPYWFIPHGQLDPWVYTYRAGVKRLWLRLFGKRLLQEAQFVIFATEQERRKASWFYQGDNTRVVHWPVELIDTSAKTAARAALCRELGIPESSRMLLYIGRLHSMKRPLETIQLLAEVDDPNLHLLIVGPDGDLTAEDCREEAERLGLSAQVHVTGPVYGEQKNNYLLGADVFISLSHRENFGHTAAESLAAGTPIILSPGNDLAPELKPHSCGWILEANEAADAVTAVRAFLNADKNTLNAMGQRGRQFIADECSPEGFVQALCQLRDEAVGESL